MFEELNQIDYDRFDHSFGGRIKTLKNPENQGFLSSSANNADVRTNISIILPFIYQNTGLRGKGLYLDTQKLEQYLHLSQDSIARLTSKFNDEKFRLKTKKDRVFRKLNRIDLAREYQKMIEDGLYKNKAELARSLGVSRAWITKVMKSI